MIEIMVVFYHKAGSHTIFFSNLYGHAPRGARGVKRTERITTTNRFAANFQPKLNEINKNRRNMPVFW